MLKKFQILVMASLLSILLVVPLAEAASSQEQEKACAAYIEFLANLINDPYNNTVNHSRGSLHNYLEGFDSDVSVEQMLADNHFALADLDGDGLSELLLDFQNHFYTVGQVLFAFKYNASSNTVDKIGEFIGNCGGQYFQDPDPTDNYFWSSEAPFGTKFFDNGYVFSSDSHNQSRGESIWPFFIYKFDNNSGVYKENEIYHARCFDASLDNDKFPKFPYKQDYDGDGVIYYLIKPDEGLDYEKNCLTLAEYKNAINSMIGGAREVIPVWHPITRSNIQQVKNELEQARNKVNVYVNGKKLNFDQPSVYSNDRLLVPVRAISEALGAKLLWDEKTRTVIVFKDSKIIIMTVGDQQVSVNGKPKTLEIAPMNSGGRIMVPLRFLSENLDCQVAWEGNTKTVRITQ